MMMPPETASDPGRATRGQLENNLIGPRRTESHPSRPHPSVAAQMLYGELRPQDSFLLDHWWDVMPGEAERRWHGLSENERGELWHHLTVEPLYG
jgi:hypothetical protein